MAPVLSEAYLSPPTSNFVCRHAFCRSHTLGVRSSVNPVHANQPSIRDLTLGILTVCLALASFVVAYLQYRKIGFTHVHAHQDENIVPLHAPPLPLTTVDASVEAENPLITSDNSRRPFEAPFQLTQEHNRSDASLYTATTTRAGMELILSPPTLPPTALD